MKRIKVLFVTDDIRLKSGVGIQAYLLMKGLLRTGDYELVSIAGSLIQQNPNPVNFEGVRLYPTGDGYGNPQLLRAVIQKERPDITVLFSDPRFFIYAFAMDNEIRQATKLVFYHTWDNEPFPKFNLPWYSACDKIVMLSKFSYNLMNSNGVDCECIPHGGDPTEFYPLDEEEIVQAKNTLFNNFLEKPEFVLFYNNRNIYRKRTADVIIAFRRFWNKYKKSALVMNTTAIDRDGTDLVTLMKNVEVNMAPIIINQNKISSYELNRLYNIADVTINVAFNEGFGLSCMESLLAGTPNIAVSTGGLSEQMTDGEKEFGILLKPTVRTIYGQVGNPYIYQDFVSIDDIQNAFELAYQMKRNGTLKKLGLDGREHIIKNYNINTTVKLWDDLLKRVYNQPSNYKRYELITL